MASHHLPTCVCAPTLPFRPLTCFHILTFGFVIEGTQTHLGADFCFTHTLVRLYFCLYREHRPESLKGWVP